MSSPNLLVKLVVPLFLRRMTKRSPWDVVQKGLVFPRYFLYPFIVDDTFFSFLASTNVALYVSNDHVIGISNEQSLLAHCEFQTRDHNLSLHKKLLTPTGTRDLFRDTTHQLSSFRHTPLSVEHKPLFRFKSA